MTVTNNHVHDVMQEMSDGGAIYATGSPLAGSVIQGNYIHDVPVSPYSNSPCRPRGAVHRPIVSG